MKEDQRVGGTLPGQILSVATTTWVWGLGASVTFLAGSFIFIKWRTLITWSKRCLLRRSRYDYKDIFKHYISHINSFQDKRGLYSTILHVLSKMLNSSHLSLLIRENGEFVVKESFGSKPVSFRVGDIEEFVDWISEHGRTVCRDLLVHKKEYSKAKGFGLRYCVQFHAEACVPLFYGGELFGIINIGSRWTNETFDKETLELLDIVGGQVAVAIHNVSLYENMVRRNLRLQEVGKLKSRLLGNVSHELRTPLNSIIGLADVMAEGGDGPVNAEQKGHLEMIRMSGKRLLDTVSSMVDLAKLEANHLSLDVRRINLSKLISKIAGDVVPTNGNGSKINFRISESIPSIYGDEGWLTKLLAQLLENAHKYTHEGEISIDAEKTGEMLRVGIHDTGIGIDPEKQRMIFEGFSQASGGTDRPYEGVGIGLAISKKVVELHGGRIWLNSKPGKGSHFYFTLPMRPTGVKQVELV